MSLPKDRDARNALPIWDGCIAYFPDVWAEVAKVSVQGNKQHALGEVLHWNTHVSTDHKNKAIRHMLDDTNGEIMDSDGTFHLAKALWRIAAALQLRIWARDGKDEHGQPLRPTGAPAVSTKLPDITDVKMDYFELAKRLGRRVTDIPASEFVVGSQADQDREFVKRITQALDAKPKNNCTLRCGDPRQHLVGECGVYGRELGG